MRERGASPIAAAPLRTPTECCARSSGPLARWERCALLCGCTKVYAVWGVWWMFSLGVCAAVCVSPSSMTNFNLT
eukprot:4210357-Prymnesium_polylepis.1